MLKETETQASLNRLYDVAGAPPIGMHRCWSTTHRHAQPGTTPAKWQGRAPVLSLELDSRTQVMEGKTNSHRCFGFVSLCLFFWSPHVHRDRY